MLTYRMKRCTIERKMTTNSAVKRMTAIHEAGHTVAHLRLHEHFYIGKITIVPDENRHTEGLGEFEEPDFGSVDDWRDEVVILCAGFAAQIIFGDVEEQATAGASSDFEKAQEIVSAWDLGPLTDHIETAKILLDEPRNRRAVERIANELTKVETLDSDDLQILSDIADGKATEASYARFKLLRAGPIGSKE